MVEWQALEADSGEGIPDEEEEVEEIDSSAQHDNLDEFPKDEEGAKQNVLCTCSLAVRLVKVVSLCTHVESACQGMWWVSPFKKKSFDRKARLHVPSVTALHATTSRRGFGRRGCCVSALPVHVCMWAGSEGSNG